MQDTRWCGVLPLCREAVGVFYSPNWLGNFSTDRSQIRKTWSGILFFCRWMKIVLIQMSLPNSNDDGVVWLGPKLKLLIYSMLVTDSLTNPFKKSPAPVCPFLVPTARVFVVNILLSFTVLIGGRRSVILFSGFEKAAGALRLDEAASHSHHSNALKKT